ncbi:unnamed protein product, partial [Scytosiphon promiscuus]
KALAPYNVYEASDGHVAIICIREGHWRKLCTAMEREDLVDAPQFATFADRTAHIDELDEVVSAWTRAHSRAEILATTQEHGVICAPVKNLQEVVDDPHLRARGTLVPRAHPVFGEMVQMQTPLRFKGLQPPALTDPPELGGATDAVLSELLALSEDEIIALRNAEAI